MSTFFVLAVLFGTATPGLCDRPIYNIGHMVNGVDQVDEWLSCGANALEADVQFNNKTCVPKKFYHGLNCNHGRDCNQESGISEYVNLLKERTKPSSAKFNKHLVLMMFDCKLWDMKKKRLAKAGKKFAKDVLIPFYHENPTKMKVIISIADFSREKFISGILRHLKSKQAGIIKKIGFEISSEDNCTEPHEQEKRLKKLGVAPGHAWLSSEDSNIGRECKTKKLKKKVACRDRGKYFSKVYTWTIDNMRTARWYLQLGLDGIIMNHPACMNTAIKLINHERKKGMKIRLATLDDNPFEKYHDREEAKRKIP
ncbi:phospholipase D LhSicTox-alphaIA1i-like [Dendronephthya gigantea]|uniref:phospholipase D LhSicTox-alphaIA1i-like n=1 Tax=Dendronephthya gigantea TaxID=151771 RepID=UPI00106DB3C8|nr:phospholipase D LhSicTox-alphaIA1i-like [Dendronephthya gigantea]